MQVSQPSGHTQSPFLQIFGASQFFSCSGRSVGIPQHSLSNRGFCGNNKSHRVLSAAAVESYMPGDSMLHFTVCCDPPTPLASHACCWLSTLSIGHSYRVHILSQDGSAVLTTHSVPHCTRPSPTVLQSHFSGTPGVGLQLQVFVQPCAVWTFTQLTVSGNWYGCMCCRCRITPTAKTDIRPLLVHGQRLVYLSSAATSLLLMCWTIL